MSNLKYAIVEAEIVISTMGSVAEQNHLKPFVVSLRRSRPDSALTRRLEAVLDIQFTNGSMPA